MLCTVAWRNWVLRGNGSLCWKAPIARKLQSYEIRILNSRGTALGPEPVETVVPWSVQLTIFGRPQMTWVETWPCISLILPSMPICVLNPNWIQFKYCPAGRTRVFGLTSRVFLRRPSRTPPRTSEMHLATRAEHDTNIVDGSSNWPLSCGKSEYGLLPLRRIRPRTAV